MQTSLSISLALQFNKKVYAHLEYLDGLKKKRKESNNRSWGQKMRYYKPVTQSK
jgi:hypothetical protein